MSKMRKLKRAVIKEEFVALTGDYLSALILNQMIYWLEKMNDFDKFIKEEITRAENNDLNEEIKMPLTHGWVYKKSSELVDELMLNRDSKSKLMSEKTIRRHIENLVKAGWLDKRTNPKYKWDRTYQYRVNLVKISEDLEKIGYSLQGYTWVDSFSFNKKPKQTTQNVQSKGHNVVLKERNVVLKGSYVGAIPEITTENTTENTYTQDKPPSPPSTSELTLGSAQENAAETLTPEVAISSTATLHEDIDSSRSLPTNKKKNTINYASEVKEVIDHLNSMTGKKFKYTTKATQRHIIARLKEGFTVEELKQVIDVKTRQWLQNPEMKRFLRPETLFSASHCDSYLNEAKDMQHKSLSIDEVAL